MSQHLESWLSSATLDLALSERQRIYEEISAHVGDTIEHHTGQGLSATDAEVRAIQDLGDAQVARAAFLRTCYTVSDERRLEKLLGRSWWTLPYAWISIFVLAMYPVMLAFKTIDSGNSLEFITSSQATLGVILATVMIPSCFFETRIKRWLCTRYSRYGVIAVQAFMTVLAAQYIYSALEYSFRFVQSAASGRINFSIGTWFIVLILSYRWIAQQAPLTLKTIRRTRA